MAPVEKKLAEKRIEGEKQSELVTSHLPALRWPKDPLHTEELRLPAAREASEEGENRITEVRSKSE